MTRPLSSARRDPAAKRRATSLPDGSPFPGELMPGRQCEDSSPTEPRTLTSWPLGAGTLEPGAVLSDRYRVLDLLGVGGMSRLYLAEQIGLGRPVALKTIYRELLSDEQSMSSFLQEARVLARVDHPNIVSVYGIGETSIGERYIAMEYVPGETLADLLQREGALPLRRAVSILLQLSRALGAVHREGVIHRDLKPENVLMLRTRNGVDIAKVADFGLAKVVGRKARSRSQSDDRVIGTPEYMSPEQIRAHGVDHRSDIYALGCIAYEMLAGRQPFTGKRLEIVDAHLHDTPAPINTARGDDPVPASFQQVVERAMAKDAKHRYGSAFEIYAGLLQAADAAGIPRRQLRLVESLFDDPAYAIVHEGNRDISANDSPRAAPRRDGSLRWLLVALCLVFAGFAIGRWTASPIGDAADSAAPAAATAPTARIVVSEPAGEFVSLDRTNVWKKVPTSFDEVVPGKHRLHFGQPHAVRATVPVRVAPGQAHVVAFPD